MLIKDIFAADITRDIAPVIYFHEQDPQKVWSEVSEYIITGGYAEGDPRKKRIQSGIHEQFVKLLRSLAKELGKKADATDPSSHGGAGRTRTKHRVLYYLRSGFLVFMALVSRVLPSC